jgi:hypothetical protein
MDAQQLLCADLGAEVELLAVGSKRKPFLLSVESRPWKQQVSTRSSRHLVGADIVPESQLWNARFPALLARNRLDTLQLFCYDPPADAGADAAAAGPLDVLVCVAGNDGDNNNGSAQLVGYLLQGKTANSLDATAQDAALGTASEAVVIATATSVSVWAPSEQPYLGDQSQHVSALAASWRRGELWQHVLTPGPRDEYELAKINYFVSYFRSRDSSAGLGTDKSTAAVVGLPFDPRDDSISVEKWPLVQAFALGDGVGEGTFFTLRHNVRSCVHALRELEANVDAQTLRVALLSHVPRLTKHWSDGLHVLSGIRRASSRAQLCEVDVAEALATFFDFGTISEDARSNATGSGGGGSGGSAGDADTSLFRGGRVMFGPRTAQAGAKRTAAGHAASSETSLLGDGNVQHFTMEGGDALSGLRAARTYWVSVGPVDAADAAHRRLYEELVDCHYACMEQLAGLLSQHVRALVVGTRGALALERLQVREMSAPRERFVLVLLVLLACLLCHRCS